MCGRDMGDVMLRAATEGDSAFVAMVVDEALDDDIMEQYERAGYQIPEQSRERMKLIEKVVCHPDTLYTWHHATMAIAPDGKPVGALVAYCGDDYMRRRKITFQMFAEKNAIVF